MIKFLHFYLFLLIYISSSNLAYAISSLCNSAPNPIDAKVKNGIDNLSIAVVRDSLLYQNFKTALASTESYMSINLYENINYPIVFAKFFVEKKNATMQNSKKIKTITRKYI